MRYIARFSDETFEIQELREHINNVAVLASSYGAKVAMPKLTYLAGLLHDMGKYSRKFQSMINKALDEAIEGGEVEKKAKEKVDHGVFGAKYIFDKYGNDENIFAKLTAEILALVCCYHHGGLPDAVRSTVNYDDEEFSERDSDMVVTLLNRMDDVSESEMTEVFERFSRDNPEENLESLFSMASAEVEEVMKTLHTVHNDPGFALGLVVKSVYSALVDADRYDCVLFEQKKSPDKVLKKADYKWSEYANSLVNHLDGLKTTNEGMVDATLSELRRTIFSECLSSANNPAGIYNLTVPTGGGKTFASMGYALEHAKKLEKERIIYVIPYTTIIEQNAKSVRRALGCEDDLLEHHSNVVANDEDGNYRLLTERWDSPIIFTTMVQFLNTLFSGGTQNIRRLHQLFNATIIFDEVQTIPIKCMYLFIGAINFLCKFGNSTAVMCSATQPNLEAGKKALTEYGRQKEIVSDIDSKYQLLERVKILDARKEAGQSCEDVAEFVVRKKHNSKSLLVICNKIRSSKSLYEAVKKVADKGTKLYYFSSAMTPEHRSERLKEMKLDLQNKRDLICVSTQVLEAGVDISFDVGVRCMAGLDSIAQAAGRINRNGEREIGQCYVIDMDEGGFNNLLEIYIGRRHTESLLAQFSSNPEFYNYSLLSPKAIEEYFRQYFSDVDVANKMPYPVGDERIYNMLDGMPANTRNYREITGRDYPLFLAYQFKKAGNCFQVIDGNTTTVIVPYGDGKDIVDHLLEDARGKAISDKKQLLKKAKAHSISIQNYNMKKLQEIAGVTWCEDYGVWILNAQYYDEMVGLNLNKEMELYIE